MSRVFSTAAGKFFSHRKKRKNGSKTRLCLLLACGPGSDAEQYTGMGKRLCIHCTSCNLLKRLATISDALKDEDNINCEEKPLSSEEQQKFEESQADPESPVKLHLYLGHSMTQVNKRGLHYQVLGLMVLVLFSGFGDAKEISDDVLQFNTTQAVDSEEQPRILAVQTPCHPEHEGFCFNGVCSYSPELDTPICRCNQAYSGMRCEHYLLVSQGLSTPEELIGISCGVVLLLGAIIVLIIFCLKKRCRKSSPPYKNYGPENFI